MCKQFSSAIVEVDCRVFKKFTAFHSLRRSPSLLREKNNEIQIDTLYRLQDMRCRNEYQLVRKEFTRHYELCINAYEESQKFKTFMGYYWPPDFNTIQTNLLRSTMFDKELVSNRGNADILPCILKSFKESTKPIFSESSLIQSISRTSFYTSRS